MKYFFSIFLILLSSSSFAQNGKIYFSSGTRLNPGTICAVDPDGRNFTKVTSNPSSRSEYQPHLSKSGQFLTFNSYRFGGWKIAIADKDGKNVRKLTKSSAYEYDARWSPDGKHITYVGFPSGRSGYRQLFIVNKDGSERKQLTNEPYAHYTSTFIEGGKRLMFTTTENAQFDVYTMNLDGTGKRNITNTPDMHEIAPALSPDGRYLAFHTVDEANHIKLMIQDLNTGNRKIFFSGWEGKEKIPTDWDTPLFAYSISWSPEGNQLAFTSHLGNYNFEIFCIDRDGKNLLRLTNSPGQDTQPHWAE